MNGHLIVVCCLLAGIFAHGGMEEKRREVLRLGKRGREVLRLGRRADFYSLKTIPDQTLETPQDSEMMEDNRLPFKRGRQVLRLGKRGREVLRLGKRDDS